MRRLVWAFAGRTYLIVGNLMSQLDYSLKPHSHCAGVATVHPDAGQPVYRDAPGHIS